MMRFKVGGFHCGIVTVIDSEGWQSSGVGRWAGVSSFG